MKTDGEARVAACVAEAIEGIGKYVGEITGEKPAPEEIATALKRYFVLKEVCETIQWDRENPGDQAAAPDGA